METPKPKNIDEYISGFPKEVQAILEQVRGTIKKAAPMAEETISYAMPAFTYKGILVYFAAYKAHIGFYALPTGNEAFQKELAVYKTGKGSIQFPINQRMPLTLITKIVEYRIQENLAKADKKKTKVDKKKTTL